MLPRDRFIAALERKPLTGRVPHFELVFFLTMEAFGKLHPSQRRFHQWDQMEEKERQLHRADIAATYIATAERYEHSAIFVQGGAVEGRLDEVFRLLDCIRDKSGDKYFLMIHGDATYGLPSGGKIMDFVSRMAEDPEGLKREADDRVNHSLERAEKLRAHGALDGFALCSDYCFNNGPFLSPGQFGEFVTPYLKRLTAGYRDLGFYVIKHTDGDIRPILDQLIETRPHALHSLDPQGNVDIADVKRRYGDRVCLIGNVSCAMLDTGTDDDVVASARYALRHGMPGGGYIFSTSNCIYTGMRLARYEMMLDVWRREGVYRE